MCLLDFCWNPLTQRIDDTDTAKYVLLTYKPGEFLSMVLFFHVMIKSAVRLLKNHQYTQTAWLYGPTVYANFKTVENFLLILAFVSYPETEFHLQLMLYKLI